MERIRSFLYYAAVTLNVARIVVAVPSLVWMLVVSRHPEGAGFLEEYIAIYIGIPVLAFSVVVALVLFDRRSFVVMLLAGIAVLVDWVHGLISLPPIP
ncbi:MAG: hypothetical protein IAE99_12290 [Rhodothermales bacterium]|nr:hypothetical protein [Rhodothermales bacterium]